MKTLGYILVGSLGVFVFYFILLVFESAPQADINVQLLDPPPGAIVSFEYEPVFGESRQMNIAFEDQRLTYVPHINMSGEVIGFGIDAPAEGCGYVQIASEATQTHWIGFFQGDGKHDVANTRFQICAGGIQHQVE